MRKQNGKIKMKHKVIASTVFLGAGLVFVLTIMLMNLFNKPSALPSNPRFLDLVGDGVVIGDKLDNVFMDEFLEYREINQDVVGLLYIENTLLSDPVLQSTTDINYKDQMVDKYLATEINGVVTGNGSLFVRGSVTMDYDKPSKNLVIYGHNLGRAIPPKQFAQLMPFKKLEFAKENQLIFLQMANGLKAYRIFANFITDIDFYYIEPNPEREEFQEIIDGAKARSLFVYDVPVTTDDNIITLSTCTYEYGDNDRIRYVIMAKEITDYSELNVKVNVEENPIILAPIPTPADSSSEAATESETVGE